MARPSDIDSVMAASLPLGSLAILVTVNDQRRPHVGTVMVDRDRSGHLVVRVGGRTRDNIASHPGVTLTWAPGERDQLIVDGTAEVDEYADDDGLHAVRIHIERAIFHRRADRSDGPTCRALPTTSPS